MTRRPLALVFLLALTSGVSAQNDPARRLQIDHAWARATAASAKTAVAYLTIVSTAAEDDRLVAAATPAAQKAEFHTTIEDKGVMKMRPVEDGLLVRMGGRFCAGVPAEICPAECSAFNLFHSTQS